MGDGGRERVPLCHSLSLREGVRVTVDHHTVRVAIDDIQTQLCGEEVVRPNPLPLLLPHLLSQLFGVGEDLYRNRVTFTERQRTPCPHLPPLTLTSLPLPPLALISLP